VFVTATIVVKPVKVIVALPPPEMTVIELGPPVQTIPC
jgi:hypothetical protein